MSILGLFPSLFDLAVDLTNICLTELTSCLAEWIGLICCFSSVDVAVTISRVPEALHLHSFH